MKTFTEIQRIGKWIYILLSIDFLIVFLVLLDSYKDGAASKNEFWLIMLTVFLINAGVAALVEFSGQYTKIDNNGVHYKFPPYCVKWKTIPLNEIEKFEVVGYDSVNFGFAVGKLNIIRKEPYITMMGLEKVVRLYFLNGKTLRIGTRKPSEFYEKLKHLKSVENDTY